MCLDLNLNTSRYLERVNQSKSLGPRTSVMIEFKFKHLKELRTSVDQPKSSGPRTPCMIGFKFKHLIELRTSVN